MWRHDRISCVPAGFSATVKASDPPEFQAVVGAPLRRDRTLIVVTAPEDPTKPPSFGIKHPGAMARLQHQSLHLVSLHLRPKPALEVSLTLCEDPLSARDPALCQLGMTSSQTATTGTSPPPGRWFVPLRSDTRQDRGCSNESRTDAAWAA